MNASGVNQYLSPARSAATACAYGCPYSTERSGRMFPFHSPISGPSRNGMVSGMYSQKYGMQINADLKFAQVPAQHKTLPETMREAGYRTALVGKWHVCRDANVVFDEVYDRIDISSNYFPDSTGVYDGPRLPILAVKESTYENEYMTDKLTSHAIQFMNKQSNVNSFLSVSGI